MRAKHLLEKLENAPRPQFYRLRHQIPLGGALRECIGWNPRVRPDSGSGYSKLLRELRCIFQTKTDCAEERSAEGTITSGAGGRRKRPKCKTHEVRTVYNGGEFKPSQ